MCPVNAFDPAVPSAQVIERAVSAVRSTVTAAGVATPALPPKPNPGAEVADPADPDRKSVV